MISALIFDLDGTIANTEPLHYEAWRDTLLACGVSEFPFETFLNYVGTCNEKVAGDYIASHNMGKSLTEVVVAKQTRYMELIPKIKLCKGAKKTILHFSGQFKLAVASSSHEKEVREILRVHDLLEHFQAILCGDMVKNKKPNPEIYLKAAAALEINPENCMAFEDSGPGLNGAKNANMTAIAIPNEFTIDHDFSRADKIIENLTTVTGDFIHSFQ